MLFCHITVYDTRRVTTGAKINVKMICESSWHNCVIWKVWMVCNNVWFI